MSYSTPTPFAHGDIPTAADMTIYGDDLDVLHTYIGDVLIAWPAANALPGEDNDHHYFVHRYRWLYFKGSGTLVDSAGVEDDITLSETSEPTLYDLNSVDWMYPGKLYSVDGSTYAMEVEFS